MNSLIKKKKTGALKTGYFISDEGITEITFPDNLDLYMLISKINGVSIQQTVPLETWVSILSERYGRTHVGNALNIVNLQVPFKGRLIARWFSAGTIRYAYEFPPGVYAFLESTGSEVGTRIRYISVPCMYIILRFNNKTFTNLIVFFSNRPIRNSTDKLYLTPFSNMFYENNMNAAYCCLGSNKVNEAPTHHGQIVQAIQTFFDSPFTGQIEKSRVLDENFPKSWAAWENMSKHNPNFARNVNWKPSSWTFADIMGMRNNPTEASEEVLLNEVFKLAVQAAGGTGNVFDL